MTKGTPTDKLQREGVLSKRMILGDKATEAVDAARPNVKKRQIIYAARRNGGSSNTIMPRGGSACLILLCWLLCGLVVADGQRERERDDKLMIHVCR